MEWTDKNNTNYMKAYALKYLFSLEKYVELFDWNLSVIKVIILAKQRYFILIHNNCRK